MKGTKNPHLTRPSWGDRVAEVLGAIPDLPGALCTEYDPELFFSERGERTKVKRARQVCARCPVAAACLEDALKAERGKNHSYRFGIRGGKTPNQRYALYALSRKAESAEPERDRGTQRPKSKRQPTSWTEAAA